jgi:hypothetical protein
MASCVGRQEVILQETMKDCDLVVSETSKAGSDRADKACKDIVVSRLCIRLKNVSLVKDTLPRVSLHED